MSPFRRKPAVPQDEPVAEEQVDTQEEAYEDDALTEEEDAPADEPDESAELENLRTEKAALFEKLARAQADFQNAERRIARDAEQRLTVAISSFLKELLPVIDNLERAMQVDPELPASAVIGGVQGTHSQFLDVLKKNGLNRIEPARGDDFDAGRHEALMRQADDEFADRTESVVTQLLQPGYALGDRVVRPAQVAVSQPS
jgi:molecular chaperone GrpE